MVGIQRQLSIGVALLLALVSGELLIASCTKDECVHTVYRIATSGDWCKQTDYANGLLIRAATADGDVQCDGGVTDQWEVKSCSSCHCSGYQAMRFCESGGAEKAGTRDSMTLWRCIWDAETDCTEE